MDEKEFLSPFQKTVLANLKDALLSAAYSARILRGSESFSSAWNYYVKIRELFEDVLINTDFDNYGVK